MGLNLGERLRRIREAGAKEGSAEESSARAGAGSLQLGEVKRVEKRPYPAESAFPPEVLLGWESVGDRVSKSSTVLEEILHFPSVFPRSLAVLVPDTRHPADALESPWLKPEDMLFFDLETTGLSAGSGTLAFLAAFGRLIPAENSSVPHKMDDPASCTRGPNNLTAFRLRVDQYLLLDYPGEAAFLEAVCAEFGRSRGQGEAGCGVKQPLVVSYNGKSFDAQILKNRCITNGIRPPEFFHADLLYAARRLWKRMLPGCSQGQIEMLVLGLDRTGDTSGALAPEIWFNFLKTGEPGDLLGICAHNKKDIRGLAFLMAALAAVALEPLENSARFRCDIEALALRWREFTRKDSPRYTRFLLGEAERKTGLALLHHAAALNFPAAILALGRDLFKQNCYSKGRSLLLGLAEGNCPDGIKAAAFRSLAVDAEWRLKDRKTALDYTDRALALEGITEGIRAAFIRRRERLVRGAG
ncbi:MAG: ribonuclease H-like domain-containing protein [Treponema sp.]|jgi:uncharacterized protein YprB with RNaseH-like and TPR domain|nr:ribonuclease H-like domain-containing protein [Treponema sp.]